MSIYCPLAEALDIMPGEKSILDIDENDYSRCVPFQLGTLPKTDSIREAIKNALKGVPKSEAHRKALCKPKKKGHKQTEEHKYKKSMNKSKEWMITFPDGTNQIVKNLSKFCRDNDLKYGQSNLIHGWSYKGYRAVKNG